MHTGKVTLFRPERGKELLWLAEATLIRLFIQARLKDRLSELADEEGITQAQMLEKLIESELKRRAAS